MLFRGIHGNVVLELDPMDKYANLGAEYLYAIAGFIPGWIVEGDAEDEMKSFEKTLNEKYVWGVHPMDGGELEDNGVYHFPGDPDLYPILKMQRADEILYQYEHGFVSVVTPDKRFIARLD